MLRTWRNKIEEVYLKQAQNSYYKQNRTAGASIPKKPDDDFDDPFADSASFEGGSSSVEIDDDYKDNSAEVESEEEEQENSSDEEDEGEQESNTENLRSVESNISLSKQRTFEGRNDNLANPIVRK